MVPAYSPCRKYNESYLLQGTMEDAHFHMHDLYSLVYTNCSTSLLPLMCSIYVPKFDPDTGRKFPPCADLCDQVFLDYNWAARKLYLPISTLVKEYPMQHGTNTRKCFRKFVC